MKDSVFAAIGIGLVLGALGAVLLARWLVSMASVRSRISLRTARLGAVVGGSLALLPSFFLAFVVGGNLGGSWGEFVAAEVGVLFGLAGGIAVVFGAGLAAGAAAGVLTVVLAASLFGSRNAL